MSSFDTRAAKVNVEDVFTTSWTGRQIKEALTSSGLRSNFIMYLTANMSTPRALSIQFGDPSPPKLELCDLQRAKPSTELEIHLGCLMLE